MARATLHVCTTCLSGQPAPDGAPRPGAALLAALVAGDRPEGVTLSAVECLSACKTGCAVALCAPGKWSYVYGHLDPLQDAPAILAGAGLYAASTDGLVAWRARPEIFRKQCIARIPPLEPPDDQP